MTNYMIASLDGSNLDYRTPGVDANEEHARALGLSRNGPASSLRPRAIRTGGGVECVVEFGVER